MTAWKPYLWRNRFTVNPADERTGYDLIDEVDGSVIWLRTRRDAEDAAFFARRYVRLHGDIDLQAFPYDFSTPLTYCESTCDDYDKQRQLPARMATR